MKELITRNVILLLAVLSLFDVSVYLVSSNKDYYVFLIWNTFLAWIPLVLSSLAFAAYRRTGGKVRALLIAVLGMSWLLFFPNSPYVVTDLVHLTARKSSYFRNSRLPFEYWYDLLILVLYSWTCLFLGAASTYHFQYMVRRFANTFISWCFVAAACVLGGYGILLGREYRLNSWDVLGDWGQVSDIIRGSLTGHSIAFCSLFAFFIGIVYVTFYMMINGLSKSND